MLWLLILVVILVLIFGGGGWAGGWYGPRYAYAGPGISIVGLIVIVILIIWLMRAA